MYYIVFINPASKLYPEQGKNYRYNFYAPDIPPLYFTGTGFSDNIAHSLVFYSEISAQQAIPNVAHNWQSINSVDTKDNLFIETIE